MPPTTLAALPQPEYHLLSVEGPALQRGFVQLPKLVLYAQHLSRDAKLLYAVLLGYAWQEQRCFPGYQRLCADLNASENAVRTWMRELEDSHLITQRRRGQGRTNLYIFHDLRTATIEVQDHHQRAVVEPQETEHDEEVVQEETNHKESGVRNSKQTPLRNEEPGNEPPFTHSVVFSTAKEKVLRALAGTTTAAYTLQPDPSPPCRHTGNEKTKGQGKSRCSQAHQLGGKCIRLPAWLPGYIVDFSREFHDEAATASNITRAVHLFERAKLDAETFIEQVYAARRITQGRANIHKRAEVGKNPAWPNGFPNRMPYFFSVLGERLRLRAAT